MPYKYQPSALEPTEEARADRSLELLIPPEWQTRSRRRKAKINEAEKSLRQTQASKILMAAAKQMIRKLTQIRMKNMVMSILRAKRHFWKLMNLKMSQRRAETLARRERG